MAEGQSTKHGNNFKDLTGRQFGHLTVIKFYGRNNKTQSIWLCRCECGNTKQVWSGNLMNGSTASCGCHHHDHVRTHGLSKTREYGIWKCAKSRCYNPTNSEFEHYGGRGIVMCNEWRHSFPAFLRDMGPCPDGFTIERKDVNGDYEPSNCCWISKSDQGRNTRRVILITHEGETLPLTVWSKSTGISVATLVRRHQAGKPLFAPLKGKYYPRKPKAS